MYIPITSNQNRETGPLVRYDSASFDEYLNNSDSYNDKSDCRSDNYNNHVSNCKSDSEEVPCISISTIETLLV